MPVSSNFTNWLAGDRSAEIVALSLITFVRLKKCQLCRGFHALGDDPQIHAAAHADDGSHYGRVVWGDCDLPDE